MAVAIFLKLSSKLYFCLKSKWWEQHSTLSMLTLCKGYISQMKLRLDYILTLWNLKNISKLSHEAMSNVFFLYFSVQSVLQPVVRE